MSTTSPQGILACSTVLPALGIAVVGLRFYTRIQQKARLEFDDWGQIPALVGFVLRRMLSLIGYAKLIRISRACSLAWRSQGSLVRCNVMDPRTDYHLLYADYFKELPI